MTEHSDEHSGRRKPCEDEALLLTQFVADHAPDAVFWIDEDGRFTYVNEAACRSLEYTCEELLRMGVPDIDPTWPGDVWRQRWEDLKHRGAYTFETVHKTKSGRVFPVEIRANYIEFGGKSLDCAYARDLTDRKRKDNALNATSQMLKLVLDTIPVAVWWKDQHSVFVGCNRLFAANAGLESPEHIVGKTDFDLPWTEEQSAHYRADDREVMESGNPKLYYEETQRTTQGATIHVRTSKVPLRGADGEIIGVLGTFEDITERKQTEEALRLIQYALDNITDAVFLVRPSGRFAYANNAACDLSGYSGEELLEMSVPDLNSDFSAANWPAHWNEVKDRRVMTLEAMLKTKEARLIPVEIRANFVEFEGREYHYTYVRDTSARKAAEAERRALERRLEEHKRKFYRETILSVTEGKLDICDYSAVKPYVLGASMATDVFEACDVGRARKAAEIFCVRQGLDQDDLSTFAVAIGEAITNALKHGERGRVFAGKANGELWVGVQDSGPGIESLILPSAVLRRGFSTKPSLGLGYSIMLEVSDRILLKTGDRGTTVVLIKSLAETTQKPLDNVPDTWQGIPSPTV